MRSRAHGGESTSGTRAPDAPPADAAPRDTARTDAAAAAGSPTEEYIIDLIPDELTLARTQLASGLAGLSEAVAQRRIARLETQERGAPEELDAARALLAEALWRQGRALAAGEAIDRVRGGSLERRRPLIMLIEAEAHAARGDTDRATAMMERVVASVGVDEAWRLRAGLPSRLRWPTPASLLARRQGATADGFAAGGERTAGDQSVPADPGRTAAAHARLEAARLAFGAGDADRGDRELMVALRLDQRIAPEGVALLEPTLSEEPGTERLLLYGDLLRAAGRGSEASIAYDRAARG
jgi:hypothetical protein